MIKITSSDPQPTNPAERNRQIVDLYKKYWQGTTVTNLHTGITVNFDGKGRKKGRYNFTKDPFLIPTIPFLGEIVAQAKYTNAKQPTKPEHINAGVWLILNFECSVAINRKVVGQIGRAHV